MGADADYVIEPEDSLAYITSRLMEIEVAIYRGPLAMGRERNALVVAEERYNTAKAKALLAVPVEDDGRKLTAGEREARAFLATGLEREAYQIADAAFKYSQDVSRSLDREKDALQTRSANLRAELQLSGKGGA
ncbi:hypothetical protein [Antrihabitans cavernicola]|uniref:TolC family protein n=1 Tax=Antrihabitans cavernicola TaxID=2495913 RepID=A0A5A7SBB6_9NOCA|nr:hypothetical protein [Spelaeibacter cavernicola]KAA0021825.1 hypothetical protein FOY51_15625 [Spelaeibacter cavernicola]